MGRHYLIVLAGLLIVLPIAHARAGITVTSWSTVAQVNGYAPTSQTLYYDEEVLNNISPATANASGDWTGPNAGGTTPTWRYVGSASVTSTTTFDSNSLTVTAAGSFAYEITTTPDFVDPSSSSILRPGAAAPYSAFFSTDVATTYTIMALLNQWGRVRFNSLDGMVIFDHTNFTTTPIAVNLSGVIPAGQYQLRFNSSLGAPNLPNGVNQLVRSGSYENVTFSVKVPEPTALAFVSLTLPLTIRRRGRVA